MDLAKNNELRERASKAFSHEFRDRLANAVQVALLQGRRLRPARPGGYDRGTCCPEGCLLPAPSYFGYPAPPSIARVFGFELSQHRSFQRAFDHEEDYGTPEAALGLLYRQRFALKSEQ